MRPIYGMSILGLGLIFVLFSVGCSDTLTDALGLGTEQPAALAEADLPNCSRVVNCCSRLGRSPYDVIVPSSVASTCSDSLGTASLTVIEQYQVAKQGIQNQSGLSDEQRSSLLTDLREQTQVAAEPGCRCFLEQTVGVIPDLVVPVDCEAYTTTGTLVGGATCDDGISAVIDTATNGL